MFGKVKAKRLSPGTFLANGDLVLDVSEPYDEQISSTFGWWKRVVDVTVCRNGAKIRTVLTENQKVRIK